MFEFFSCDLQMYIESLLDSPFIDDPVQLLVDMVWQEAVGSASSLVDMEALTKEKVLVWEKEMVELDWCNLPRSCHCDKCPLNWPLQTGS